MLERVIVERHPVAPWKRFLRKGVFPYKHVRTLATLKKQVATACGFLQHVE